MKEEPQLILEPAFYSKRRPLKNASIVNLPQEITMNLLNIIARRLM